ncbi:putative mediator of RNA polymerase II transcription subunit 26 isoform X1 [Octopus sinensis]|uniref:Mediator of RNA polymerase II transcription subunit 26 isoform X1 n=1 Tax=Octopus sinensis TaxID=2607531 RepID=A0A7E6ESE6_9MOLL|nr:putative mediator of RNA polymerase II transcription subunit 26 isoform X1 [Octopus sinensis]
MSYIKEPEYSLASGNVHPNQRFEDVRDIARRNVYCPRNCHQQETLLTGGHRHCNYHSFMITSDYNSCPDDYILECVEDDKEYILRLYLQEGYRGKCHGYQCHHQSQLQNKQFDYNTLQNINRCNQIGKQRSVQNSVSSASEYYTDELEDDVSYPEKQCQREDENHEKDIQKHINVQKQECLENKSRHEYNHYNCLDHRCRYCCFQHPYGSEQYDDSETFSQTSDNLQECETTCPFHHQHEHHHHHYHHYYCDHNRDYYMQYYKRYPHCYPSYYDENQFGNENNKYYAYERPKKPEKYSENTYQNQKREETPVQQTQKSVLKNKDKSPVKTQISEQKQGIEEQQRRENKPEGKLKEKEQYIPQASNIRKQKSDELRQEKSNTKSDKKNGQQQKPKKQELQQQSENVSHKKRQVNESPQLTKHLKQKRTTNNHIQNNVTSNKKKMQGGRLLKREYKVKQIEKQLPKPKTSTKQTKKQEREQNIKNVVPEINGQSKRAKQQQFPQKAQKGASFVSKECPENKECSINRICPLDKECCVNKECTIDKECCINKECAMDKECCVNKECSMDKECCANKECSMDKECCVNKECPMGKECCVNKECPMGKECCVNKECPMDKECFTNKQCSFNKDCSINQQCEHRSPETCHGKCQHMVYRLKYCKTHLPYQNSILIKL